VSAVSFMPLGEDHRPLLQRWLSSPHAQEWWGEPVEELRLIYAVEDGEHEPFIACIEGAPIAYVQAWWPSQHSDIAWVTGLNRTTRGIDITIGEAENLGKGLGSLILKAFAAKLFAEGATRIVIDPDERNQRAVACYLKAGFTPFGSCAHDGGIDLLMELLPEDLDYGSGYAKG
jgi:aminoglycoside 6'-N-acetyltransferase